MATGEHSRTYAVVFMVVAILAAGYVCYRVLAPFLAAIAWAAVLAVAFRAPWGALERRLPRRRNLAAALLTLAIALVVLLPASVLIGVLASQAVDVATRVAARLSAAQVRSFSDVVELPVVASFLDGVKDRAGISPEDFQKMAAGFIARASGAAAGFSARLVLGLFDALLTFVMAIFLLFFFFRDGAAMAAAVLELLPTGEGGREAFGRSLGAMLQAIFRGSLLCAVAQGVAGAIGWWIAGLPSPVLAGAATAVLSLLPVGGTALAWLPGSVYLWSTAHRGSAIFLFIWGLVVTSFLADNVLRPLLIRGTDELSTPVVFLGVFGGLAAFGLLGIFIGPVALALGVTLVGVMRAQSGGRDTLSQSPG
ncbi:MAG: AI-2E family transporter [Acidobacteriota bacterium]